MGISLWSKVLLSSSRSLLRSESPTSDESSSTAVVRLRFLSCQDHKSTDLCACFHRMKFNKWEPARAFFWCHSTQHSTTIRQGRKQRRCLGDCGPWLLYPDLAQDIVGQDLSFSPKKICTRGATFFWIDFPIVPQKTDVFPNNSHNSNTNPK